MSSANQSLEQHPICDNRRESASKLANKMRKRGVKWPKCRSKLVLMASLVGVLLLVSGLFVHLSGFSDENNENDDLKYGVYGDFLINGPNCKIPNMSPFDKKAMKVFHREEFKACSSTPALTSVQNTRDDKPKLIIHEDLRKDYVKWWQTDLRCCYQRVVRSGSNGTADMDYEIFSCKAFNSSANLNPADEFIIVTCKGFRNFLFWQPSSVVYHNAHAIVRSKESVQKKLEKNNSTDKVSVFLMGIDSISRLNLIRALPETYEHLENSGWFEMRGFNKIGDNTFPNLMAILTGHNESIISEVCNWKEDGELEKCRFIWNDFNDAGYVTAYAEDLALISTFNYYDTGFINQPTDYYLRPFAIAAEKELKPKKEHGSFMCLGYQHYADHVYQYGLDFAAKYRNDPSFGLFWTNSFSHEDLSMPSSMDSRVVYYLEQLELQGVLDSSIVIFFSDHGMRFGPIRKLFIGWLEERLPFLYIWLPQKFQKKHPEIVRNLEINRDRLSSPYDVHITLKQILQMSGSYKDELSAISCPTCQSLFEEIPFERECDDAGISKHWCTCVEFDEIDHSSKIVRKAANLIVSAVNADLAEHPKCAKLHLNEIHSARKSIHKTSTDYLVSFNVKPSNAELEATVRCDTNCDEYELIGSVSRLNLYGNQSICVSDSRLRKYCYCK